MSVLPVVCRDDERRRLVRAAARNGIDYVEVSDDQLRLCVHFLAAIPTDLRKENVRVVGGRRVRDIVVTDIRRRPAEDPDLDDCLEITVDRYGDFSTYQLCIVALDASGTPTGQPYPGFDQRYSCIEFSFKEGCPSTLDCKPSHVCPPEFGDEPAIDYLAKDYATFRSLLLDRLALLVPDWRERHVPDLGVALVELLAYVGDQLSYYQDAVATEAYFDTARLRQSVRRHARLVDYVLHEGCNARAFVVVEVHGGPLRRLPDELEFLAAYPGAPSRGTLLDADLLPRDVTAACFEPLVDDRSAELVFRDELNQIALYTWGDRECCLPKGATSVWLVDQLPIDAAPAPAPGDPAAAAAPASEVSTERPLQLHAGDHLLLEEVVGPDTGNAADADRSHRQVVRITSVTEDVDELTGTPVVLVTWDDCDALTFPLCISTIGPAPDCHYLEPVSVARGNVVLVDHGCTQPPEPLAPVPDPTVPDASAGECEPADAIPQSPRYRPPPLAGRPLTYAEAVSVGACAADALVRDSRAAQPQMWIEQTSLEAGLPSVRWDPRGDLLDSGPDERHFVVEIDDDGGANLRFGDDRLGEAPEAGERLVAHYRVGNGAGGNVGAETIAYVAARGAHEGGLQVFARNPLPARGAEEAETTAEAKLLAPTAFRSQRQRAIVADDYAELTMRDFPREVQQAGATLRWTGSWYEALVSVDERGVADAEPELLTRVGADLERYRRIGHDLNVLGAQEVALEIALVVCVQPQYLRAHVEGVLIDEFSDRALPDGTLGFFHPDRLTPGTSVTVSGIIALAQSVEGVESVEVVTLRRMFDPFVAGTDRVPAEGALTFAPWEVARCDSDRAQPDNGAISFDLRGGR